MYRGNDAEAEDYHGPSSEMPVIWKRLTIERSMRHGVEDYEIKAILYYWSSSNAAVMTFTYEAAIRRQAGYREWRGADAGRLRHAAGLCQHHLRYGHETCDEILSRADTTHAAFAATYLFSPVAFICYRYADGLSHHDGNTFIMMPHRSISSFLFRHCAETFSHMRRYMMADFRAAAFLSYAGHIGSRRKEMRMKGARFSKTRCYIFCVRPYAEDIDFAAIHFTRWPGDFVKRRKWQTSLAKRISAHAKIWYWYYYALFTRTAILQI